MKLLIRKQFPSAVNNHLNNSHNKAHHQHNTQLLEIYQHTIILTNDASQVPPFLKDLFANGPSFLPTTINYDWAQP